MGKVREGGTNAPPEESEPAMTRTRPIFAILMRCFFVSVRVSVLVLMS